MLFLFTRELAYVRINISSNTWNGYTAENQEERLFSNETAFLVWCHAQWKLGSSNCCIFEMKHATGMETWTKIYFLFIFNLVWIRIRKTSLFWLYNFMTSLWKPFLKGQPSWCSKPILWKLNSFLTCKRFLIFQSICIDAGYTVCDGKHSMVSEVGPGSDAAPHMCRT